MLFVIRTILTAAVSTTMFTLIFRCIYTSIVIPLLQSPRTFFSVVNIVWGFIGATVFAWWVTDKVEKKISKDLKELLD